MTIMFDVTANKVETFRSIYRPCSMRIIFIIIVDIVVVWIVIILIWSVVVSFG